MDGALQAHTDTMSLHFNVLLQIQTPHTSFTPQTHDSTLPRYSKKITTATMHKKFKTPLAHLILSRTSQETEPKETYK